MNKIGIIQGRLSTPTQGKIQSFPFDTWEAEFAIARELGFEAMELCVDSSNWQENPLLTNEGTDRIIELSKENEIDVVAMDPLYLTERGLLSNSEEMDRERIEFMKTVLPNCKKIGMEYILMPIIIGPSLELVQRLKSEENMPHVLDFLRQTLEIAKDYEIKFALETSLNAEEIFDLMDELKSSSVVVCYDTGNSAFFGHDLYSDIEKLLPYMVEVHIKDHKNTDKEGAPINYFNSVPLGTGNVDFDVVFDILTKKDFIGTYILQMARGVDHIEVARSSLDYVRSFL
jgi:L-ribulose-5-phosphate 3-epimerase